MLQEVDKVLLTSLDEIAWILNVRGNDIEYNPLVISYLIVSQDYVKWFVKKSSFSASDPDTEDSFSELVMDDVEIEDYDAVYFSLSESESGSKLFADPSSLNYHVYNYIKDSCPDIILSLGKSPVILEKAVKTESEV